MKFHSDVVKNCDCVLCKNDADFTIHDELLEELLSGSVTIFAGAGVSTESKLVLPENFYQDVARELSESDLSKGFPELMEQFCRLPNGRFKLLKKIKDRFNYIYSFPDLYRASTRFHKELSTFFPVKNIVTTNWDTYFENLCFATPFVYDPDLAFWEVAERRVLKIHGSITQLGSIVATKTDYDDCEARLNSSVIGSLLKTILATQTVIFIGYSLSDSDFLNVFNFVKKQMSLLHKQPYVVNPSSEACAKFEQAGFISIKTDGTFFLSQIKKHATSLGRLLDDEMYQSAEALLAEVEVQHSLFAESANINEHPECIFSFFYQDGLIHSLERALTLRNSGCYSNPEYLNNFVESYRATIQQYKFDRRYEEVAYIEGYIRGLLFLRAKGSKSNDFYPSLYYLYVDDKRNWKLEEVNQGLRGYSMFHFAEHTRALELIEKLNLSGELIPHHNAWLT